VCRDAGLLQSSAERGIPALFSRAAKVRPVVGAAAFQREAAKPLKGQEVRAWSQENRVLRSDAGLDDSGGAHLQYAAKVPRRRFLLLGG